MGGEGLLTGIVTSQSRKYCKGRVSVLPRVQEGGESTEMHIPSEGWSEKTMWSAPCALESSDREQRTHAETPVQEAAGEGVETCVARSSVSTTSAFVASEGKRDPHTSRDRVHDSEFSKSLRDVDEHDTYDNPCDQDTGWTSSAESCTRSSPEASARVGAEKGARIAPTWTRKKRRSLDLPPPEPMKRPVPIALYVRSKVSIRCHSRAEHGSKKARQTRRRCVYKVVSSMPEDEEPEKVRTQSCSGGEASSSAGASGSPVPAAGRPLRRAPAILPSCPAPA